MAERVHAVSVDFPIKFTPQRNFRLLLTLCHGQGWPVGRFEIKLVFNPCIQEEEVEIEDADDLGVAQNWPWICMEPSH